MLPFFSPLAGVLLAVQSAGPQLYSIPTSEEVRVASMAALDEGYDPNIDGTFLDELLTPDGKQPHPGYKTIGLYSDGSLVHSYAIRVQTGDVVDARTCQIFEYPNLLKFKQNLMTNFGTDPVSRQQIAEELNCAKLEVVRLPRRARK